MKSITEKNISFGLQLFLLLVVVAVMSFQPVHAAEGTEVLEPVFDLFTDTNWVVLAGSVVGLFSIISTMTPNKTDNKIADFLLKVINLLGANVGKSENTK